MVKSRFPFPVDISPVFWDCSNGGHLFNVAYMYCFLEATKFYIIKQILIILFK